jgi:hypothetical protein
MAPPSVFGPNPFLAPPAGGQKPKYVVDPAAEQGLLSQIKDAAGGTLSSLLWALDTPGAFARGTLAGGLERGLGEAFASEDDRTSGRELLREYGLAGDEDNWGNWSAGLGAEILTDPLNFATGGIRALSTAGKAADAAGLMSKAPRLLSRAYLNSAEELAPELVERATAYSTRLGKTLGREALSEADVAGRPLVGRRTARKFGTLGNLIDYADNPMDAERSVRDWLSKQGIEDQYEDLLGQRLGGDIGLAPSFMHDPRATFSLPVVGDALSDTFDRAEDLLRWTFPGRAAAALTQRSVGGATDAAQQAAFAGTDEAKRIAKRDATRESVYQAAKLYQGAPEVFSEEGNRTLGRLIEKPLDSKFGAGDAAKADDSPAIRNYLSWWEEKAAELPAEFREVGLNGAILEDPNVAGYLPRRLDGVLERERGTNTALGRVLSTMTPDQMARTDALKVPGGRDTIAFDLSLDPVIAGPKRTATTDQAAAQHIAEKLFGPAVEGVERDKAQLTQSMDLARLLHRLPDTASGPAQLYAQHPTKTVMDYVSGRAGAGAVQRSIYDSMAAIAKPTPAPLVEQGRHIPLSEALNRFGARNAAGEAGEEGARQQMRQRLAKMTGEDPDKIELAKYSVPEDDVNRLLKVQDGFTRPESVNTLLELPTKMGRWWKAGILSVPKRIVRDLYSGMYSNWLEGALDVRAMPIVRNLVDMLSSTPYVTARELAQKSAFDPEFVEFLGQMPRYAAYPPSDRAARYYSDLAAEGLLGGGYLNDAGLQSAGVPMTEMMPGVNPMTFTDSLKPLASADHWKNFGNLDKNPIAAFGAKAGNLSDTINRLTGYNSLLLQGIAPEEAARRMKRAHVDYESLTPAERAFRDTVMPFYAYTSRITGEIGRQLIERPGGRFGQGLRVYENLQNPTDDEPYVPEQLRSQFAVPIPGDMPFLGSGDPNYTRYFTDIDLPGYDQLNMIDPSSASNTASNFLQGLAPPLRMTGEFLTGKDAFTKEPIGYLSKGYGPYSKIARSVAGPDAGTGVLPAVFDRLIDITPFASRPARTLATLIGNDEDRSFGSRSFDTAFNELGLGRFKSMSKDRIAEDQIKRLQELAAPYTKDMTIPYIPESQRTFVPKDALDAFELARSKRSEIQKARRDTRKSGGPGVLGGNPFIVQ